MSKKMRTIKNTKQINKKLKTSNLPLESTSIIKTIILVVALFVLAYLCMLLLGKIGFFDKSYEKPVIEEAQISYDEALVGTSLNRPDKVYYVAFDYFGDSDKTNKYFQYIVNAYGGSEALYKVDMTLEINAKYLTEEGNINANNIKEFAIKIPTLIKVKNGKIMKYLEDVKAIKKELSN